MKIKNQSSFPSKYRLFILIAVCVILLGIGSVVDSSGPLRFVANYTVIPFQKGISYAGQWMSDASANFQTMEEMHSENESLQSKVDELTIDNTRLRQEQYELERLRELYKLDENYSDYEKVGARVISNNGTNWFSDFTIDKGSNDGIKVNCNVLAGSGLVGIVTEVGPDYARVRSIIDDASNVSAMMLSTSDLCVVEGSLELIADGRLKFERLPNNDNEIEVGEQVVTSHVSDRFVQGLFIGYVSEIEVDSNNLTRSGYITPAVDFAKLQEVLVITTTKDDLVNARSEETATDTAQRRIEDYETTDYYDSDHFSVLFPSVQSVPAFDLCRHTSESSGHCHGVFWIYAGAERRNVCRRDLRPSGRSVLGTVSGIQSAAFCGDRLSERHV